MSEQSEAATAPEVPVRPEPADDPAAVAADREARQKKRLRQTVRDMVLSMLVVTGVVVFLVAPWNWRTPDPVKEVDAAPVIAGAREAFDWPVLAPLDLPATWRATSARVETADDGQPVVVLGWVSPATEYVGLQQSPTKITDFVPDVTLKGVQQDDVVLGTLTWTRYVNADETRRSLARTDAGITYVVTGTGPWDEIEGFTRTLRAG
ncbi:DUF4245 domain-containing protein [Longivirga aurantiaca]|uniref:DUF4245 domain-containing protein n=1 Tax=Longivirga aurantiaca TaxID=1837743 RepID=A0ABW1SY63_9ACTN